MILPTGGRVHFVRISAGTGFTDAEFEHTTTSSPFYRSRLKWNGNGWNLTLKNGLIYVFGDEAPLHTIQDRYGNKITISRAGSNGFGSPTGRVTKLTSSNGRWIEFTYDASNRITQAQDNIGRTVNYTYDASGRLWKVTDPKGGVTEYTYDTSNRMLSIKDARGIVFLTNQYDAAGGSSSRRRPTPPPTRSPTRRARTGRSRRPMSPTRAATSAASRSTQTGIR